jgi:tetratricopeptide (TPR) repeat protein
MEVCVRFEREIGHPDADKHAYRVAEAKLDAESHTLLTSLDLDDDAGLDLDDDAGSSSDLGDLPGSSRWDTSFSGVGRYGSNVRFGHEEPLDDALFDLTLDDVDPPAAPVTDPLEEKLVAARKRGDRRGEGHALGDLGRYYATLGQPQRAIDYYSQALVIAREISSRSGEAKICWNLGLQLLKLDRVAEAISVMEICVHYEQEVGHPDAAKDAARVAELKQGRDEERRQVRAAAFFARGLTFYEQGDYGQAVDQFSKAIQMDPNDAQAYYHRGLSYVAQNEYQEAVAEYTHALQLNPKYIRAYYHRGIAYQLMRDLDHAIADYTRTLKLEPRLAQAFRHRAQAYHAKGDSARAKADFDEARRIDPNLGKR